MNKLSKNKKAYLLAVGMGIGAGAGAMILMNVIFSIDYDLGRNSIFLLFSNLLPIVALIFLFIISKKFSVIFKNTRTKASCLFFLLFAYTVGFYLIICLVQSGDTLCFLLSFLAPIIAPPYSAALLFANPTKLPLLITILYSSISVAAVSYLVTKEITNLSKRIVLFFIIGFVVYIIAVTPLITMSAFY